jgi:hypothetical protein
MVATHLWVIATAPRLSKTGIGAQHRRRHGNSGLVMAKKALQRSIWRASGKRA